jgi:hypothetical protein
MIRLRLPLEYPSGGSEPLIDIASPITVERLLIKLWKEMHCVS